MGDEFCTSRGISSIVVLRQKASSLFQIVPENDNDNINSSINQIASKVKKEIKEMLSHKLEYKCINIGNLFDECNSTLLAFLSKLTHQKFNTHPWQWRVKYTE